MKKLLILIIILIILVVILITMAIFPFLNKNKAKIIETKTFSEISGFSFDYPVFKGWEVNEIKKASENEYTIFLNWPENIDFDDAPQIKIVKKIQLVQIDLTKLSANPNGVKYIYNEQAQKIFFHAPGFTVDIYPFMYEGLGHSGKISTDKIIETFKFSR